MKKFILMLLLSVFCMATNFATPKESFVKPKFKVEVKESVKEFQNGIAIEMKMKDAVPKSILLIDLYSNSPLLTSDVQSNYSKAIVDKLDPGLPNYYLSSNTFRINKARYNWIETNYLKNGPTLLFTRVNKKSKSYWLNQRK